MIVTAIKTHKITTADTNIFEVLDTYLPAGRQGLTQLSENSVVAVTSKIVATTQGKMIKIEDADKDTLIEQESQYFLPRESNKYKISFTITQNILVPTAGIDESNGNGYFVLWPENPQKAANEIRAYLQEKHKVKNLGVIITDSKTTPMRWGVTAIAVGYSGFLPLYNYAGKEDLFGRTFQFEQMSVIDSLATSAAFVMGEGAEQTPLAIISDISHIEWNSSDPTPEELSSLRLTKEEDLYAPFLQTAPWKKGKKK